MPDPTWLYRRSMTIFRSCTAPSWGVALLVASLGLMTACTRSDVERRDEASARSGAPVQQRPSPSSISGDAGSPVHRVRGQLLYVPSYSHINVRDERRTLNLATTLSIRNASRSDSLVIDRVDYYDNGGELVRRYLDESLALGPLASTSYVVREEDLRGGVGANFLVRWTARRPIDPPVVETVHITTQAALGVSFTSAGRVLSEQP